MISNSKILQSLQLNIHAIGDNFEKYIDHVITFQTTPQAAMGMAPGDYFRVSSNSTHTSRFNNGSVNPDGVINSVDTLSDGTYSIYYWRPNTEEVQTLKQSVRNCDCIIGDLNLNPKVPEQRKPKTK